MKNVLAWCKSHLAAVICSAIIILVLPLSWFFSTKWNDSIRTKRQSEVESDLGKLKVTVPYSVPSIDPTVPALTLTAEPNEKLTAFFKAEREKVLAQSDGVVKKAIGFNRAGHEPLLPGLLPDARGQDAVSKAWAFTELLVGKAGVPSVYQTLFDSIAAGDPQDPNQLAVILQDRRDREVKARTGEGTAARPLTPDEDREIVNIIKQVRLGQYQSRARTLSVYATPAAVLKNDVPLAVPKEPPTLTQVFGWQMDYWLISDVLAAVRNANSVGGRRTTIDSPDPASTSVVKRIDRLQWLDGPWGLKDPTGSSIEGAEAAAPTAASPDAQVPPDYKLSISGRWSGPSNGVYDVRYAYLTCVVSAARLPQLIDAISRTNFMTVTDVDLTEVNVYDDLAAGFYYGDESVVRARIEIEAVYLRAWTSPFMPAEVKKKLGIAIPEPAADAGKGPGGK